MRRIVTSNPVLCAVGRVTPCAPFSMQAKRRAEDCAPYLFAFAGARACRYARRMDLPTRKKLPHTIAQWVAEGSWFFITINSVPPGKNPVVPRTNWRRRARDDEI